MPSLMEVLQGARPREPKEKPLKEILEANIAEAERRLTIWRKALAELEAIGPERVDRVLDMMNTLVDPDAPPVPVLHPGPHGPGCDCVEEGPVN
jgi:hypothetical protein